MQELATLSDIELARLEKDIKDRAQLLETREGKIEACQWVLRLFKYLRDSGYKMPDNDVESMSKTYARQLKDAIAVYGYNQISLCVDEWIKEDTYKRWPNSGQILQKVKEMCGNPIAEVARRNYEAEVNRIVDEERKRNMEGITPERMAALERKYKHE